MNGSCLLYIVVWLPKNSTPGVLRAQDDPGACGSSRFLGTSGLTQLKVLLHLPLFATTKNHDEMEATEALWCCGQKGVSKLVGKPNGGPVPGAWFHLRVLLLKTVCSVLEGEETYPVLLGRGPRFCFSTTTTPYPAFLYPGTLANKS